MGHYSDSPKPENSGRMNRLQGRSVENEPENFNPLLMNDPAPVTPQPAVTLPNEKERKPAPAPANPPKKTKEPKSSPSKPKEKNETDAIPEDDGEKKQPPKEIKEKYSIYLPKKLSLTLRLAYSVTRDPYSTIVEDALTDMLYNRYQCHEPDCHVRFSMSETDATPTRCPCCGKTNITPLRIDVLD